MSSSEGQLPFHTIHPTYSILHWTALDFCREDNKRIVRKAAGRPEQSFLMIGEQQEEALQDQISQLNHCPCPNCCISLLHLFLKAGLMSTHPGYQLRQPAHPCEGGLQLITHLLGLAQPPGNTLPLASWFCHHLSSLVSLPTAPIVWRLR